MGYPGVYAGVRHGYVRFGTVLPMYQHCTAGVRSVLTSVVLPYYPRFSTVWSYLVKLYGIQQCTAGLYGRCTSTRDSVRQVCTEGTATKDSVRQVCTAGTATRDSVRQVCTAGVQPGVYGRSVQQVYLRLRLTVLDVQQVYLRLRLTVIYTVVRYASGYALRLYIYTETGTPQATPYGYINRDRYTSGYALRLYI